MKRIAVFIGSRADREPLQPLIKALGEGCRLVVAEGMYNLEATIRERLEAYHCDLFVVLGDRFETLIAAAVATELGIPIAHLSGGDITVGANDDSFRHAITKLSYWHFPITEVAKERIIGMGEDPARVYNFGAVAVDNLAGLMGKREARLAADIDESEPHIVFAWHPETLGHSEIEPILEALAAFPDYSIVTCASNGDRGGAEITRKIEKWALERNNWRYRANWDNRLWNSLVATSAFVIGNSSAWLIEAPTLGTPVVSIGTRQAGRVRTPLIIDVPSETNSIVRAIKKATDLDRKPSRIFGTPGKVAKAIAKILLNAPLPSKPVKRFYE